MNYRHQWTNFDKNSPDYGHSRGWRVLEGAKDSKTAARYMLRRCGRLQRRPRVAYGVSMGATASGLAVSSRATEPRSDRPLFNYWFDVEGVSNIAQEYLLARAVGDRSAREIERDFGGTYDERPHFYERHSIVNRYEDIKASGIKGVVLVQAKDDFKVPYMQSRTMVERLSDVGVRSQFFTVYPNGAPVGHGQEVDLSHPVIKTGLDRLGAFLKDRIRPRCFQEFAVDGASGEIIPDPAIAAAC